MDILNYNIRSFNANFDSFLPIVEQAKPYVLILTETWFTENYHPSILNFNAFHSIRPNRSGGVSIFIINELNSRKIDELSYVNDNIEVCTSEISLRNEKIFL